MLTLLRQILHKKELSRYQATNIHLTEDDHFEKLRTIGIVFCANDDRSVEPILKFTRQLAEHQFEVELLGYFDTKGDPGEKPFPYFTKDTVSFKKTPKAPLAQQFIKHPFDALLNLDLDNHPPINYIAAASQALFKVGRSNGNTAHYDLMLDLPRNADVSQFIQEIRTTLNSIKR